jgi:hypothetical protein
MLTNQNRFDGLIAVKFINFNGKWTASASLFGSLRFNACNFCKADNALRLTRLNYELTMSVQKNPVMKL